MLMTNILIIVPTIFFLVKVAAKVSASTLVGNSTIFC
jgi:hypothetical protein